MTATEHSNIARALLEGHRGEGDAFDYYQTAVVNALRGIGHALLAARPVEQLPQATLNPEVTYEPDWLAGKWAFVHHASGRRSRLTLDQVKHLYRACDAALVQERKAEEGS